MAKAFQYHPFIPELKVAEDGSQVIYKGEPLHIHTIKKNDHKRVAVNGKKIGVTKLVLEAFVETRPSLKHRCVKIDHKKGIHYTNLKWQEVSETIVNNKRKLTDEQEDEIVKRFEAGETRRELAKAYGLKNINTISAIKNRVKKRNQKD